MNPDEERYKLCLECVYEDEHLRKKCPSFRWRVLSEIKECMRYGYEWRNICYHGPWSRNNFGNILCRRCPYQLEHIALNNGPVLVLADECDSLDAEFFKRRGLRFV